MTTAREVARLARLHTAHWEVLAFLMGPIAAGQRLEAAAVAQLSVLALLINAFIFTLNDLADLPRDRLNPRRQRSPLVAGTVSEPLALFLSCLLPVTMWLVIAPADWPSTAEVSFAALVALGAYLDVFQKTSRRVHPIVLDALFATCMAGPIPVSVLALGGELSAEIWLLALSFGLLCLGLNSIGGNLKDLASDRETGFRTVAIALGVDLHAGRPIYSAPYKAFVRVVVALSSAALLCLAITVSSDGAPLVRAGVIGVAILSSIGCGMSAEALLSGRREPSASGRDPIFALGMISLLVSVAAAGSLSAFLALIGCVALIELGLRVRVPKSIASSLDG